MLDRGGKLWMLLRVSVCSADVAWSDCCDSLSLACSLCDKNWLPVPVPLPLRVSFAAAVRKELNIDSCQLLLRYPCIFSFAGHPSWDSLLGFAAQNMDNTGLSGHFARLTVVLQLSDTTCCFDPSNAAARKPHVSFLNEAGPKLRYALCGKAGGTKKENFESFWQS